MPPSNSALEDVATPFEPFTGKEDAVDCTDEGPDGFQDLTLNFDTQEIVAILSTPDFDATTEVDKSSLTFGRTGDEDSLARCTRSNEDVNGDGLLDVVCHFRTQDTGFQSGDTEGILKGKTVDNVPIEGRDAVRIVH